MDYDYVKYDEMLHRHLDEMWRDEGYLEIGEDISNIPEIKIIFDGYADLETEDEEGNYVYEEGGNKNLESYAIFIHKRAAEEGFEFPEHEMTPWGLIHRPEEEVCIYAWYNVEDDEWEINGLYETSDHKMTDAEVMEILEILDERYFGE
jgi:hypothetical protein